MLYRALPGLLLLLASSIASAKSKLDLEDALQLAQKYVLEKKIPNGHRYLESVAWHEDRAHPERSCWVVFWAPNELEFDAQLVVWVSNDGTVKHQSAW
jgi:hypothetical protein